MATLAQIGMLHILVLQGVNKSSGDLHRQPESINPLEAPLPSASDDV